MRHAQARESGVPFRSGDQEIAAGPGHMRFELEQTPRAS
jgi:hypothetical protein